ncbi:MAG: hypothetical protein ACLSE6_00535 [Alphaproteobacteria bacterium]
MLLSCHGFLLLSCPGFFVVVMLRLDRSISDTFLSVIYCLTRRVQRPGQLQSGLPIKSGNDGKESKSDNDCKWKAAIAKAERQNKTLSPAGRTPASYT